MNLTCVNRWSLDSNQERGLSTPFLASGNPHPNHSGATHTHSRSENPDTGSGYHKSSNRPTDNNMLHCLHNLLAFMLEDYGVPGWQNMIHIKSSQIPELNLLIQ